MKLKEKLSLSRCECLNGMDCNTRQAFIAGFEKAREMAAEKAQRHGLTIFYSRENQPWSAQANLWLRAQNLEIKYQIMDLGEEDVEE